MEQCEISVAKISCQHIVQSGRYSVMVSLEACTQCPLLHTASRTRPLPSLQLRCRRCFRTNCTLGDQVHAPLFFPTAGIFRQLKRSILLDLRLFDEVAHRTSISEDNLMTGHHSALGASKGKPGPSTAWGNTGAAIEGGQLWVSILFEWKSSDTS